MANQLPATGLALGAIGMAVLSLAGCSSTGTTSSTSTTSSTGASASQSSASASASSTNPTSSVAPVGPTSGLSNGQTYTVSPSSSTGATDDGVGKWTLKLNTISGGDAKVAEAFNTAVQASAQQQLDGVKRDARPTTTWNFETVPHIFFSSASVSERLDGVYYAEGAAHPIDTASTVVIDSRSATPITLKNLFSDEQAGLDRLSQQTKQLLAGVLHRPGPMADEPGNAAVEANFANWVPTPQGIELAFNDGQFGKDGPAHGIPTVTVPWAAVDDLLAPGMTALRQA